MNITLFKEDLHNGLTLDEALQKHKVSLDQAFKILRRKDIRKVQKNANRSCPETYILKRNDVYTIRKSIKGKTKIFGAYNSLEDALLVRDTLIKEGWKQRSVDDICKRLGVERRGGHVNCKVRYS